MIKLGNVLGKLLGHRQPGKQPEVPIPPSPYIPRHLSRVTQIYPHHHRVDLMVMVYLPNPNLPPSVPEGLQVEVKVGSSPWQALVPIPEDPGYWCLPLTNIAPETPLTLRYRDPQGQWHPIAPLTDLERVFETTYVPNLHHPWAHGPRPFTHAQVLVETTLEGLLAGYEGGVFAPRSREEMLRDSLAHRILQTNIPHRLAQWEVDNLMVVTISSVADRSYLNTKFNYLTYDVADVDWQVGRPQELMKLIDTLYRHGISLVPDLPFGHQVRRPFPGSLDQITSPGHGQSIYVDDQAFLFRDYGTWMFKLEDPQVRRQLVEKIAAFVVRYHLRMIRLDYVDGLVLQYANRPKNYGEVFLRELKSELKQAAPDLIILGETFAASANPAVQGCMDLFYAPIGFTVVEELYKPPAARFHPDVPSISALVDCVNGGASSSRRDAVYAQLHDETSYDEHIAMGRPTVPWAYGHYPAELAKLQGEALVAQQLLPGEELLNYVRHTVRNAEALTLFTAKLMYMFVPAVDALTLGSLDDPGKWTVQWGGVSPEQLAFWKTTGLSESTIYWLHERHRAEMVNLRHHFRRYSPVDPKTFQPLVFPQVCHADGDNGVLGIFRCNALQAAESLLIIVNLGSHSFWASQGTRYEFPAPAGVQQWEVLFNGEWVPPHVPLPQPESVQGYEPGSILAVDYGDFLDRDHVLRLEMGAQNLLVLKPWEPISSPKPGAPSLFD